MTRESFQVTLGPSGGLLAGSDEVSPDDIELMHEMMSHQTEAEVVDYFHWTSRVAEGRFPPIPHVDWAQKAEAARQQVPVLRAYIMVRFGVVV